jgi:cobalt/nickel transport system permease protein
MEGFLPPLWCAVWWILSLPCLIYGIIKLRNLIREERQMLPLLGICGAFIFILSALKLPSVTGSCSHPTGTGLSAICFGPFVTAVLGSIVLLFQALFLAHGGLSTLGANIFSMGICGPAAGYAIYRLLKDTRVNVFITVFLAAFVADITTYIITSLEIALAYPAQVGGFMTSFISFLSIFAITQLPLAIMEGCVIALVFKYIIQLRPDIMVSLKVFSKKQLDIAKEGV